jgi:hypothetical protein
MEPPSPDYTTERNQDEDIRHLRCTFLETHSFVLTNVEGPRRTPAEELLDRPALAGQCLRLPLGVVPYDSRSSLSPPIPGRWLKTTGAN